VQKAVLDAHALLEAIHFTGHGLLPDEGEQEQDSALNLASTLDPYNNGNLC
jgi:hypothetical protein